MNQNFKIHLSAYLNNFLQFIMLWVKYRKAVMTQMTAMPEQLLDFGAARSGDPLKQKMARLAPLRNPPLGSLLSLGVAGSVPNHRHSKSLPSYSRKPLINTVGDY